MRILLWKIGALGDVIMTTPLVRHLRAHLPHAQIDYLVGRSSRAVLEGNPHIDRLLEFDERILFGPQVRRLGEILRLLRGYDAIYVLDKHWVFGWLARVAGIPRRIGFRRRSVEGWPHTTRVPYGVLRHEIDCYLELATAAGIPGAGAERRLEVPPGQPFGLAQPYVVAINSGGTNPGEASQVRKLPPTLFADLVEAIAVDAQVVFLGSGQERAAYEELAARHGGRNLCGTTTVREACDVLARAQAVYTTDTGLMHVAGAVCPEVTAVFGPTHPLRKCPPGARWIWRDQDRYDARYDLFGRLPQGRYFDRMTVQDILQAGRAVRPPGSVQPQARREHHS